MYRNDICNITTRQILDLIDFINPFVGVGTLVENSISSSDSENENEERKKRKHCMLLGFEGDWVHVIGF